MRLAILASGTSTVRRGQVSCRPARRRGFDYWAAFNRGHFYYNSTYYRDENQPIHPEGFEPTYQTDLAIDFLRRNRERPFYLYLSWGPPHTPRDPPPEYAKLYDPRQFHLAPNVPADYAAEARKGMAGYYGLCSSLDHCLGRLLKILDELMLTEDTLLVFTSDHGDMLGAHGLEFKDKPYEESARIPLLMRYPRMLRASSENGLLISNVDLMPTFLSLCGARIPAGVQGRNLMDQIFRGKGESPESVFCYGQLETASEWRMVVRGLDKLVVNNAMEITHLYNLGIDRHEQDNLAGSIPHKRTRDELKAHLAGWMRRIGYTMDPSGLRKR